MTLRLFIPSLLALFLISSCASKEQPVTQAEALATAKAIDSAINNRKPAIFDDLINVTSLSNRMAKHANKKVNNALKKGVAEGLKNARMGDQILRSVMTDGHYQLVKQYEKDKIQHLIYRLYSEDGLNYHDFELAKVDGKVYIADIYIYLAGDDFSTMLADFVQSMDTDPGSDASSKNRDAMVSIDKMKRLIKDQQFQEAKKYFDELPANLRSQKLIRLIGIQIVSKLDSETYLQGLAEFERDFPNEPNIHLLLIDASLLRKDYDKALKSIEKLDQLINKDPFLDYYRGLVLKMDSKPEAARPYFEAVCRNLPDFGEGYLELIAGDLELKEYDKASTLITKYERNKKFNQETLQLVLNMYPDYQPTESTQ